MEFCTEEDDAEYEVPADVRVVAEILLELPRLIHREAVSRSLQYLRWGTKRKRGSRSPPNDAVGPTVASAPVPDEHRPSKKMWADASSPDTPLIVSYSGDSVDPKSAATAAPRRKSVKRAREELRRAETEAQRENDILRGEINKLKRKIDWERSLNIELKRTQKLLFTGQTNEKAQWEKEVNTRLTLGVPSAEALYCHMPIHGFPEPLIPKRTAVVEADKTSEPGAKAAQSLRPSVALLNFSPAPVLDLNLPAEENGAAGDSPLQERPVPDCRTLSRAAAAEARMRRHYILKAKLRR